uniref:DNA 3'-5' helicase n=1 Tax=Globodera pallida TaxID=36090 RepID=A0A183C8K4_GLOPA
MKRSRTESSLNTGSDQTKDNKYKRGQIMFRMPKFKEFSEGRGPKEVRSDTVEFINGLPWRISIEHCDDYVGIFLFCDGDKTDAAWTCRAAAQCGVVSCKKSGECLMTEGELDSFNIYTANCCSWGYEKFVKIEIRWVALTATANQKTEADIVEQLQMKNPKRFKSSTYRPNIFYEVIIRESLLPTDALDHMAKFVKKCFASLAKTDGSKPAAPKTEDSRDKFAGNGIIYCQTRADCEPIAQLISKKGGIPTDVYHAGLSDSKREEVQQKWMSGEVPVVVATIAFGMGVDKATVRFVVHWNPPQNMANYYQESGRAGRDGHRSFARVYYSRDYHGMMRYKLASSLKHVKTKNVPKQLVEQRKKEIQRGFDKMVEYLEGTSCRHALLGEYFDDRLDACASHCDACKTPQLVRDSLKCLELQQSPATKRARDAAEGGDASLYGGGRKGQQREAEYYQTSDDARGDETHGEREERLRVRVFLQKELKKRRRTGEASSPNFSSATNLLMAQQQKVEEEKHGDPSLNPENQGNFPFLRSTDTANLSKIPGLTLRVKENKYKRSGQIVYRMPNFKEFSEGRGPKEVFSDAVEFINGLPWRIMIEYLDSYVDIFMQCDGDKTDMAWSCRAAFKFSIVSCKDSAECLMEMGNLDCFNVYTAKRRSLGHRFAKIEQLMDPKNGLYDVEEDAVTFKAEIVAEEPIGMACVRFEDALLINGEFVNVNRHVCLN